jgi:hypothetical protein
LTLLAKRFDEWLATETTVTAIAEVTPAHLQQYQIALYNSEPKPGAKRSNRLARSEARLLLESTPLHKPRDLRDRASQGAG